MARGARQLEQAMEAYFARCDGTRERVPQKGGGFAERQIPYTLYGLCEAVDLLPEELLSEARQRAGRTGRVLSRGLVRVAAYLQERALLGEVSSTAAQGALKELGLIGEGEPEAAEGLQVILDEQGEVYSR